MLYAILVVLLILALVGFPYGGTGWHSYGYWPSGALGLALLIILIIIVVRGVP